MNQKGFAKIIPVVIIAAVVAISIYLGLKYGDYIRYYIFHKGIPPGYCDPGPCITPTPTATANPTANWKIYKNTDYGFQLTFTDTWVGYRVYKEQQINNSGVSYIFAVPTKDKTFSDIGVPSGYYRAFIIFVLDKHASIPWDTNGPHPKYLISNQTMNFYISYPQDIPDDLIGKIKAGEVVSTFKLTQ